MPARYTFKIVWEGPDGASHETRFRNTIANALNEWTDLTVTRERQADMFIFERNHFVTFRSTRRESIA